MAITEDVVYSGANEKGGQPIGFYFNSVACTNAAETIVDDVMDANFDTLCEIRCAPNATTMAGVLDRFEFVVSVDGTQITLMGNQNDADAYYIDYPLTLIIPANTNLKITGDNTVSATSTECSVYVIIKPLVGSLTV